MKYRKLLSFSVIIAALVTGCNTTEIDEVEDAVLTKSISEDAVSFAFSIKELNSSSVTFHSEITLSEDHFISSKGVVYSNVVTEPTCNSENTTIRKIFDLSNSFDCKILRLQTNKTYYARTFAVIDNTDTLYSEVLSFVPSYQPTSIQTMSVFNRVKRAAIVCGKFLQAADDLESYGICLSKNPNPTIKDVHVESPDTAEDKEYSGIFGAFFDDLEENTMYHVRAYAITAHDTVYGNDRIFKTTKGGDFNWQFNNIEGAIADGADERIRIHVDSAMYYYRNYTNLNKYLWVNYAPGTPTADCNIEGWMRVGENSRYQWVGTIQHEMCHALGVGTASNWWSFASPWNKEKATLTLRVMMKDMSVNISKDNQHFWPGGINQQEEVTNGTKNNKGTYTLKGALMLKANALVINAMREDGLLAY